MEMALRFSGWLKVTRPTPSSFAASIFPPANSRVVAWSGSISDHSLLAHIRQFRIGIADGLQDILVMLSGVGCVCAHGLGKPGDVDGGSDDFLLPHIRALHHRCHAEMLHCGSANTWSIV